MCSEDYLPVATTRPETLLGDTAVAVNPEVCHQFMLICSPFTFAAGTYYAVSFFKSRNLTSLYAFQDERYKKYIGKTAVVPLSGGREVPIIADEVHF